MQVSIARQLGLQPTTVGNFFMNARRRLQDKWKDSDHLTSRDKELHDDETPEFNQDDQDDDNGLLHDKHDVESQLGVPDLVHGHGHHHMHHVRHDLHTQAIHHEDNSGVMMTSQHLQQQVVESLMAEQEAMSSDQIVPSSASRHHHHHHHHMNHQQDHLPHLADLGSAAEPVVTDMTMDTHCNPTMLIHHDQQLLQQQNYSLTSL